MLLALALTLALSSVLNPVQATLQAPYRPSDSASSAADRALAWLASSQYANGTYGPYPAYSQIQAAPAAYALWLNNSLSSKARTAYTWLASEFSNSASGIWYEADIAGEILYALSRSNNLGLLTDSPSDYARLLALQQSNGGFQGFFDLSTYQPVTSSVDTAMALWGLVNAGAIASPEQQSAINYLLSLQNPDGSFNLTSTIASNPVSALGPEPISITASAILVFKNASYTASDPSVSKALNYLSQAVSENFSRHVFAAALSALAFTAFGWTSDASNAISFIISNQNADGGFRDEIRTSEGSNALDTGWAAIALQLVQTEPVPTGPSRGSPRLNPLVIAEVVASVVVPVAVILGLAVYYRREKERVSIPASPIGVSVRS